MFRYELRNLVGLDRLWEFNVRELVFVGSEEHVADCRRRVLPVIGELAAIFDLECRIETASDPFFATVSAARTFWQRAQEVKNEIMLTIEPGPDGSARARWPAARSTCTASSSATASASESADGGSTDAREASPPPAASASASSAGCWRRSASTASSPSAGRPPCGSEIFG